MKAPIFPERLGESTGDDALLRDVLSAARDETMDPSRAAGVLAAFETAKGVSAPSSTASKSAGWWSSLPVRLGTSLAIACALGLGWRAIAAAPPPPSQVATSFEAAPAPPPVTPSPTRVEDLPPAPANGERAADGPTPSDAPAAPSAIAARRPRPAASSSSSAASSFHEELAVIESARAALARGDEASCLRILDGYGRRFRSGVFADEVVVMRIEALAARGDHDRARELGDAFLRKNPESAYASRIRSVLSTATSSDAPRQQQ